MAVHAPAPVQAQDVTFTRDIAPILQRSCIRCHRPDSIAPMSLITYDDVRPWARAIRDKTSRPDDDPERMPPWFIEKNVGIQKFKDDISLTPDEVARIGAWVDGGAPRGDPADLPEYELAAAGWTIGEPDLVVSSPSMTLPATAPDYYGRIGPSPTGLTADRYVKAVEFREIRHQAADVERKSGDLNYFVVHHAVVGATAGVADGEPQPGQRGENFFVVWELGQNATIYPDSLGVKLAAGSALNFDLHTHSIGTEATFTIDVAFKLHPEGFVPKYTNNTMFDSLTYDLDIPGNKETVISALYPMTRGRHGAELRAAPALQRPPHVRGGAASERLPGNHQLRRVQPQLGEGLLLRGRRRAPPAARDHPQGDSLVRQHRRESPRHRPAQLEGLGQPLHRRHVLPQLPRRLAHGRGVRGRGGRPHRQGRRADTERRQLGAARAGG